MEDTFIQIPNNIVWNNEEKDNTLINKYGDKILYILCYLNVNTNRFNITLFSLEDMIISCGLIPRTGKDNINNQFIKILDDLLSTGIITIIFGDYRKLKDFVKCIFNMPLEDNNWFPIMHEHYEKIMNSKLNRLILLKVYSYISARLRRSTKINGKIIEDVIECTYVDYYTICEDLDITGVTLNKYLLHLKELGVLYYDNIGLVSKHNNTFQAANVYCFDEKMLLRGLLSSKAYYKDNGFTIIGKKTLKEKKEINGLT